MPPQQQGVAFLDVCRHGTESPFTKRFINAAQGASLHNYMYRYAGADNLPTGMYADIITNGIVFMGLGQNIAGYTNVHEERHQGMVTV